MSEGGGRSLTRREFDAVIRRAAELSTSDPDGAEGALTEGELLRIAGEVGLSESHVRRALAEVRSGDAAGGIVDRFFGPPHVRASRVVPGNQETLASTIDEFLVGSQLLQPVRRAVDHLLYRPAVDWASQVARAASFTSWKYYIASARSVEVRLEQIDEENTLVELLIDPGTRGGDLTGAGVGGGVVGVILGTLSGVAAASAAPVVIAVGGGVLIGASVWAGIAYGVGREHKKKVKEVRTEVEGVLDALEMGISLQPPPPSWRRWVKRHFHGVARDLRGTDETNGL